MNNATTTFWLSSVVSIAGGVLSVVAGGSLAYLAIGYGLGSALGSALAEWLNSRTSIDEAYDKEQAAIQALTTKITDKTEEEFDNLQNEYLSQLIEQVKIDSGQGRKEISSQTVIRIEQILGNLEAIKSIWIDLSLANSQAAKNYAYAEAGVSAGHNDFGDKVASHSSQALSKKMSYALSITRESLEVNNRVAKARETYSNAQWNFIINAGVAVVCAALGGGLASSLTPALAAAGQILLKLTSPIIGLLSGAYNIIFYARLSRPEYGELIDDYDHSKIQRDKYIRQGLTGTTDNLDKIEAAIITEATKKMLSRYGLNSGFFGNFQTKVERLYEVKQALFKAMDLAAEQVRIASDEFFGYYSSNSSMLSKLNNQNKVVAFAAVENILNSLRSMTERYNEMNEAELMMYRSLIGTAIAVVEFAISVVTTTRNENGFQLSQQQKAGNISASDAKQLEYLNQIQRFWKPLQIAMNVLKIINSFSATITTAIYQSAKDSSYGEKPSGVKAPEGGVKGTGASLMRLEALKVSAQMAAGQSTLERQRVLESAELMETTLNDCRSFVENVTGLVKEEETDRKNQKKAPQASSGFPQEGKGEKKSKAGAAPQKTIALPNPQAAVRKAQVEDKQIAEYLNSAGPQTMASC